MTATQTPNSVHRTKLLKEPQYQGYVASLLVASAVTLWAVIGELTTVVLLFEEIRCREAGLPRQRTEVRFDCELVVRRSSAPSV